MRLKPAGLLWRDPLFYAPDEPATGAVAEPETPEEEVETPESEVETDEEEVVTPESEPAPEPTENDALAILAKAKGVTPEELKARLDPPVVAQEPEKPSASDAPPEIPDFRSQAYSEAVKYPQFTEIDEYGDRVLNEAGVTWAENRAVQLHVIETSSQAAEKQALAQLQASKPEIAKHYADQFKKQSLPVPEEIVNAVADDFASLAVAYGTRAFDESTPEKAKVSTNLRTQAFYIALGMQKEREIKAQIEGGEAGDKAPEPAKGGGGSGAGLYEGLSKADQNWLKNTWSPEQNGGKPPTKEQIAELKKRGAI